jgi:hypothetical protein
MLGGRRFVTVSMITTAGFGLLATGQTVGADGPAYACRLAVTLLDSAGRPLDLD